VSVESQPIPRWTAGAIAWVLILATMAGFQTWRGAYVDGILFFSLSAMLVIDRLTRGRILIFTRPVVAPRWLTLSIAIVVGLVLVVAPRHSSYDLVAFAAIGMTVLIFAWEPAPDKEKLPRRSLVRSALIWSMLGVALCLWEAIAFILSVSMPDGNANFPTISVLLDPFVESLGGRIIFVVLWLAAGLALLRFWSKK
jgi:hypothetical protein